MIPSTPMKSWGLIGVFAALCGMRTSIAWRLSQFEAQRRSFMRGAWDSALHRLRPFITVLVLCSMLPWSLGGCVRHAELPYHVKLFPKEIAKQLIEKHGDDMAPSLHQLQTILPYSRAKMFTAGWGKVFERSSKTDMKTKVHIKFDAEDIPGDASAILGPAGCSLDAADIHDRTLFDVRRVTVRLELDKGDERVAKVFSLLAQYGIESKSYEYTEYSDEDRQNARLLWMTRATSEYVSAGHMDGTKYDRTEACANCGTGARQTSALYIDGDDGGPAMVRKHRAIGTWDGDILVDGGMVKKLKDAGVTGISFGEVRARLKNKKWSRVAREQILIAHTMPPMRAELTPDDQKDVCKVCQRGGFTSIPEKPYWAEDLVGMQDFNLTWEWYGDFWPKPKEKHAYAKYPHPVVFVTPKVMNIFREAGVKTFAWVPVVSDE